MNEVPPLSRRLLPLVVIGWIVAAIRLTLEFQAPEQSMWFGVYYVMPILLIVIGLGRRWGPIGWVAMAATTSLLAVLVWGVPNSISYTLAQFLEWTHGRFEPEVRAAPIASEPLKKIGVGLLQGLLTSLAGAVWCTVAGTLFIWIPERWRRRRAVTKSRDPTR
jgi:hypothetical protein